MRSWTEVKLPRRMVWRVISSLNPFGNQPPLGRSASSPRARQRSGTECSICVPAQACHTTKLVHAERRVGVRYLDGRQRCRGSSLPDIAHGSDDQTRIVMHRHSVQERPHLPPTGRSPGPPAAKEPGQTTLSAALGICPPQPPSDGPHVTKRGHRGPGCGRGRSAVLHGGEACVTISMSRAERADLGQRGAQPGAARRRAHDGERTTVPVDTAEGGQVVRLAHLLRLNPPDGRSSHIEWQPEGHRRL